jgi:hypothetical protein
VVSKFRSQTHATIEIGSVHIRETYDECLFDSGPTSTYTISLRPYGLRKTHTFYTPDDLITKTSYLHFSNPLGSVVFSLYAVGSQAG